MFLAIGPYCWARDAKKETAIKNAKKNFPKSLGGKWRYIVFEVTGDDECYVDGMGYLVTKEGATHVEIERKGM